MCGICGIISLNSVPVREESVMRMMQIQKHRGPNDEGIFTEDNIGLGFVRLSILDLSSAGNQPMISDDGNFIIVYNGEVFNYIELREELKLIGYKFKSNSDTEVLLKAYQQWGEECLPRLNGMWAFLIYNRKTNTVFASRDRYGIKPFYYYLTDDYLSFSSEIPPLLSLLPGKPTVDYNSIFDYLVFNRTDQTERTFFSNIKKLQHGHNLIITLNKELNKPQVRINKWYDLQENILRTNGIKSWRNSGIYSPHLFLFRMRSDVPVGVCLSGGLDSSSIVSVLKRILGVKDFKDFFFSCISKRTIWK